MICERRDRVLCVTEEHAMCGSEECACMRVLYRRGRQVCIRHKCAHRLQWIGPFCTLPFTAHVNSTYCAGNLYSYATGGLTVVANLHNRLTCISR